MKKQVVMAVVLGAFLSAGASHAEKWDKNEYHDAAIESSYYDLDSIKSEKGRVSWTER